MSTVRKTITLTHEQDDWIKAQVDAGHYIDEDEYIRDLIRREQERRSEIESIRAALVEGENSGEPKPFDAIAFKERIRAVHG
jgi:antitoxin ParD1/3/4